MTMPTKRQLLQNIMTVLWRYPWTAGVYFVAGFVVNWWVL